MDNTNQVVPAIVLSNSSAIKFIFKNSITQTQFTEADKTTINDVHKYAKTSVFTIHHITSHQIVIHDFHKFLKLFSKLFHEFFIFSETSFNQEAIEIVVSITAHNAQIIIQEKNIQE